MSEGLNKLIDMGLHEIKQTTMMGDFILRVPGGWVYIFPRHNTSSFVPEPYIPIKHKEVPPELIEQVEYDEESKHIEEVLNELEKENDISSQPVHSAGHKQTAMGMVPDAGREMVQHSKDSGRASNETSRDSCDLQSNRAQSSDE